MPTELKRTFIAFRVQAGRDLLAVMERLRKVLYGAGIKWVDPEKLHVTLTFIGDTPAHKVADISRIMDKHVPLFPAPDLCIRGMGVFRSINNPRVIWLGLDPIPGLNILKDEIDHDLRHAGFKIERREFKPHLTLGRIKSLERKSDLAKLIRENQDRLILSTAIRELVLYESILRPEGPRYIPLGRAGFRYDGP